uniref:non-specific serine/threonine protein kinase n=1 Tax=Acrobeloides nanus TaxID=290746 RepID=A0A914C2P2_9BILA
MHDRNPPISHRDLKIENLLFDSHGFTKLCDFGSATMEIYRPDDTWSAIQRSLLEEDMAKFTTPMYRAPEILDTYQNYPIGPSQDIWALGCILYYLCYRVHPFEDSAKLRIINAKYTIPEAPSPNSIFSDLIRSMLQPDPYMRPVIYDICDRLEMIAFNNHIDITKPVTGLDLPNERPIFDQAPPNLARNDGRPPPPRPPPPGGRQEAPTQQNQAPQVAEVFSQIKGQGLSLFKNIRDKSAAVLQTVQTSYVPREPQPEPPRPPRNFDPGPVPANSSATIVNPFENSASKQKPPPQAPSDDFFSTLSWGGSEPAENSQPKQDILYQEVITTTTSKPQEPSNDFFSSLGWDNSNGAQNIRTQPAHDVLYQDPIINSAKPPRGPSNDRIKQTLVDEAEAYERLAGIRVGKEVEADDADEYRFDYEKKDTNKNHSANSVDRLVTEVEDLLDIGPTSMPQHSIHPSMDPFACFESNQMASQQAQQKTNLLNDIDLHLGGMTRNASAPVIEQVEKPTKQQFERLFANDASVTAFGSKSANTSQTNLFGQKSKLDKNTFDDLLSNQGFNFTTKNANRTLADLKREEEIRTMDPVSIKIRDWKKGKERNIRALIGSLHEVLWEGANGWSQPNMADLFAETQVKKYYRKACLVVHPDKQVGLPHEDLAKAIFSELNEAWTEFASSAK